MAADNFIDAVKSMHAKMNSLRIPVASPPAPSVQPANTAVDVVKLIRRYPQLLLSRTGK